MHTAGEESRVLSGLFDVRRLHGFAAVVIVTCLLLTVLATLVVTASSVGAVQEYHEYRIGVKEAPDTFNPFDMVSGTSWSVANMMYEFLYAVGPMMEPYPQLAASHEVSNNNLTWTYHLAEDSYWHDGVPVTADDVVFTFEMIMDYPQECALLGPYVNGFDEVLALDNHTVQIELLYPKANMLSLMVPILPEHLWSKVRDDGEINRVEMFDTNYFPDGPVGSGPFKLIEYSMADSYIRLEAQKPYHRLPGIDVDSVNIDELLFVIYTSDNAMVTALETGEIDVVDGIPPLLWESVIANPDIDGQAPATLILEEFGFNCASKERRESVNDHGDRNFPSASTNYETCNLTVRQACAMATDIPYIANEIHLGMAQEAYAIIPTATPFWHYEVPEEERWDYGSQEDCIEAANQMLEDAGYRYISSTAVRENKTNGALLEFEFYYIRSNLPDEMTAEMMKIWWADIGVKVNLHAVSEGILYNLWFNMQYDMFIWSWWPDVDPTWFLSVLTTYEIPEDNSDTSAWSDTFYSNPYYDQLWLDQQQSIDLYERQAIVHEMQRVAYRDCPYICLVYPSALIAYRTDSYENFPNMEVYTGISPSSFWYYFSIMPIGTAGNTAPYNVDAGDDVTLYVGDELTLTGSAEDLEHSQEELNWSWECIEPDSSIILLYGQTVNYTFENPGIVEVTLTVTDPMGLWDSDALMVTVALPPLPPVADFTVTPELGYLGTTFAVDASSSYDSEDPLEALEVRWDWNNDGAWDTEWTINKTAYHQILIAGEHTIVLEVRDTDGMMDNASRTVEVFDSSFEQGEFPERVFTIVKQENSKGRLEYVTSMVPEDDYEWWLELVSVNATGMRITVYENGYLVNISKVSSIGDESDHVILRAGSIYTVYMQYLGKAGITELVERSIPISQPPSGDPILINGDEDFTYENGVVSGDGSVQDPYVIEGWDIEADTASGITILNTEAHFVIRDVHVFDGLDNGSKSGIRLIQVTNGTVMMCTVTNCEWGIAVFSCSEIEVIDNDLTDCYYGVGIVDSNGVDVWFNRVMNSHGIGIAVNYTIGFYFSNNTIINSSHYGVMVVDCQMGYVASNAVAYSDYTGIRLRNSEQITLFHNALLYNHFQAYDDNIAENAWNLGYPIGGNYWSNYTGVDLYSGPNQDLPGSDGIGDTPYTIGVFDQYPLMASHPG